MGLISIGCVDLVSLLTCGKGIWFSKCMWVYPDIIIPGMTDKIEPDISRGAEDNV